MTQPARTAVSTGRNNVYIADGPAAGRRFRYPTPLPAVLVITQPTTDMWPTEYHDYRTTRPTKGVYRHDLHCKCYRRLDES